MGGAGMGHVKVVEVSLAGRKRRSVDTEERMLRVGKEPMSISSAGLGRRHRTTFSERALLERSLDGCQLRPSDEVDRDLYQHYKQALAFEKWSYPMGTDHALAFTFSSAILISVGL